MWRAEIVKEACRRFKGTESSLRLLGGFYENVFEYERDGEACVLKLIPIAGKDRDLVYSEYQWVSYLRQQGINIPRQVLSTRGQTVEVIQRLPVPCCVISFKKASGKFVDEQNPAEWNAFLFRRWGQVMGKMHALSGQFHQRENVPLFEEWNEGEIFHRDLSFAEGAILDRWSTFVEKIETFPKNRRSYGLIHNDLHQRNFLLQGNGDFVLFDFDDVKYHWFTYDIAIALYHALTAVSSGKKENFKEQFLEAFMSGYLLEHQLEDGWKEQVNFFLEYRFIFSYLYLMTYLKDQASESLKKALQEMRMKLERGKSVLEE